MLDFNLLYDFIIKIARKDWLRTLDDDIDSSMSISIAKDQNDIEALYL